MRFVTCAALNAIASVPADVTKSELHQTLADIRILAAMGKYYAAKFRGARDLKYAEIHNADAAKSAGYQASAVTHLTNALSLWTAYAELSAEQYHPTWINRIGSFDLKAMIPYVAGDIAIKNNDPEEVSARFGKSHRDIARRVIAIVAVLNRGRSSSI